MKLGLTRIEVGMETAAFSAPTSRAAKRATVVRGGQCGAVATTVAPTSKALTMTARSNIGA
jgi:hypothetical protein